MQKESPTSEELALEQSGLEFLRNGKFRKARDAFKSLNKSQPSRALPLLIEANLGLANEMMSKGLVSEANQVLAYLKTIAPPSFNLDLTSTVKETNRDTWAAMVPLAAQRLASDIPPDALVRAADEIILGADSPDHPGHPDAKAILSALELGYGSAATKRTTPLLRSVPRSSPFSHWVFFFKGMTALESGERDRAAECFRRIPENSLLQASLPALLALCDGPAAPRPNPPTVRALCAWAGHPALAEPLLQAEPLWRKKRRAKAFTQLTKKIPKLMCWGAREFKADLTRFLTREYVQTRYEDSGFANAIFDYAEAKAYTERRAALDQAFFTIDFADHSSCAHHHFQGALDRLRDMPRVVPISPAMLSRIFTRLAEGYIVSAKRDPYDRCSPPNAKKALEQAIKHDPDHLHAWLTQCDLLSMGRDTSAYHRFLDDLTKRFPSEKEVLIRNGECCIGRGSFTKALRNFEKAEKIDSVDPRIAGGILRARLGIAEAAYKKRKPSKANWELIDSMASASSSFPLWRLRLRRLVLEARHNANEEVLVELAAATLPLAPSAFLFEVACRLEISRYGLDFNLEFMKKILPSRPPPQSLADFLAVIDEAELAEDGTPCASVGSAARLIFGEHQDRLLEYVVERKDLITLLLKILSAKVPNLGLASPVIEKWLARDPSDPILRFLCRCYRFVWLSAPLDEDLYEITAEIRDSKDSDDMRLLVLLEKDRQRAIAENSPGASPKLDLDYDPHGDGGEYDDDDFDDDEMEEAFDAVDKAMGSMSPAERAAILAEIIGGNFGGPIDPIGPGPKKPASKNPPEKRPEPDPNQLDFDSLFNPPPKP